MFNSIEKCCVKNCESFFTDQSRKYFKFPENDAIKKNWLKNLRLDSSLHSDLLVCSKHFPMSDFSKEELNEDAVPTDYLDIQLPHPARIKREKSIYVEDAEQQNSQMDDSQSETCCRICLQQEENMVWLFEESEKTIAQLYNFCTGLEISENDNLPQYICKVCHFKLLEASTLKQRAIISYKDLKSRCENQDKMDPEMENPLNNSDMEWNQVIYNMQIKQEPVEPAESPDNYLSESKSVSSKATDNESEARSVQSDQSEYENDSDSSYSSTDSECPRPRIARDTFYCEYCELDVEIKSKQYHLKAHTDNGLQPIMVCKCDRRFYFACDLDEHSCFPLYCQRCKYKHKTVKEFKMHLTKRHCDKSDMYSCTEPYCRVSKFSTEEAYRHLKMHYNQIRCDWCSKKLKNQAAYRKHKVKKHARSFYSCDYCGQVAETKEKLTQHLELRLKANACLDSTKYRAQILAKKDQKGKVAKKSKPTDKKDNPLKCDRCEKSYKDKKSFREHKKLHNAGAKKPQCKFCQKEFSFKSGMNRHVRNFHKNETK